MGKREEKSIVITGASGFIGSACVRYLNDQGKKNLILVDDLKESEKWKNLVGKQFVDLISKKEIFHWLEGRADEIDSFLHLGACTNTCETNGDYLVENNFHFSCKLSEYALKHDKRFIYASSAASYGDGSCGFSDNHEFLEPLQPLNLYGYSKHLFDLWLWRQGFLGKAVGLKYFNVFGPNEYHKGAMASMIHKKAQEVVDTGKLSLFRSKDPHYKNGEQKRDFIYVKDVVALTCRFLEADWSEVSGIFNIGRGEAVTWNLVAKALFTALGKEPHIEYISMPKELENQYQNYTCADIRKIQSLFSKEKKGFVFRTIEDATKEYIQDYWLKGKRW